MKKRIFSILLILTMLVGVLPAHAARGMQYLWIECEDAGVAVSGEFKASSSGSVSGGATFKVDCGTEGLHEAKINFAISNTDEYDIFLLGTPGNTNWCSTRKWKLDDGEYAAEKFTTVGTSGVKSGDIRDVPFTWYKVTTTELTQGNHSLGFAIEKKAPINGLVLTYLDCIAVVPSSWEFVPNGFDVKPFDKRTVKINYADGQIPTESLEREQEFDVSIRFRAGEKADAQPKLYASLTYNGEVVAIQKKTPSTPLKSWGTGVPVTEKFKLTVPFNAPDGVYEIRCGVEDIGFADGTNDAAVGEVIIGEIPKTVEPMTVKLSNAALPDVIEKNKDFTVTADLEWGQTIDFETTPYISIWQGDVLWGVIEGNTKLNNSSKQISFTGKLEEDIPAGQYQAYVGTHWLQFDKTAGKQVTISGTDSIKSEYHKPMSYGYYYSKKTGRTQFWYILQSCTAVWNGEPYIPFGGMAVLKYIYGYSAANDAANKANFEQDKKDLEMVKASGINDLYINPVRGFNSIPTWALDYLLQYLEEEGWYYGIQIALGQTSQETQSYWPKATTRDYKLADVTEAGEATLEIKLPGGSSPVDCIWTVVNDETGEMVDSGVGTAEFNANGNVEMTANVTKVGSGKNTIYFTPKTWSGTNLSPTPNFWNNTEESTNEHMREWLEPAAFGENLRMTVDHVGNEVGIYNSSESTRFTGDGYEELYEAWLKEKYGSIDKLNDAWKTTPAVASFKEASYLVPVYTADGNEYSYYVDGSTGKGFKIDMKKSVIHADYLNGRDAMYLDFNNSHLEVVKEYLDVPAIYKHCALQRDYFINDELVIGLDGVGSEAYGSPDKVTSSIGTTGAHAVQSARTSWNVITESNTNENVTGKYNDPDQHGYPSLEAFHEKWVKCLDNGTRGIYDFLLVDRPDIGGNLGKAYSWVDNPSTIEYAKVTEEYVSDPKTVEKLTKTMYQNDTFNVYPHHYNWWWNPNEREVAVFSEDNNPHQILKADDKWVIQTDDLYGDTRLIFVNLSDGPMTAQYGPQLSQFLNEEHPDKRICVLGHRNDLGAIPEVDKYYTEEKVAISDSETVQVLNPIDGAEVLKTTEDGKPWAIKVGELYIVSVDNWYKQSGEFCQIQYVDELGITDVSALKKVKGDASVAESVYSGFADMKGHWAESHVNEMKDKGIASGVGDNMFNPEGKVTVAEFASLVTRVMNYADVEASAEYGDKWYAESMTKAYENGILTEELKSQPDRPILREEMAVVAAKALSADAANTDLSEYTDADEVSEAARGYVKAASDLKLLSGMGDGTFAPKSDLTRAQSIVVIKKLLELK